MTRIHLASGAHWEPRYGYSRAVRLGDRIVVTGTTATLPDGGHVAADDVEGQTRQTFSNIGRALAALGASFDDVIRTRIYVVDVARNADTVGVVHAEVLGHVRPATTMVGVPALVADWMQVEIEAEAVAASPPPEFTALPEE